MKSKIVIYLSPIFFVSITSVFLLGILDVVKLYLLLFIKKIILFLGPSFLSYLILVVGLELPSALSFTFLSVLVCHIYSHLNKLILILITWIVGYFLDIMIEYYLIGNGNFVYRVIGKLLLIIFGITISVKILLKVSLIRPRK